MTTHPSLSSLSAMSSVLFMLSHFSDACMKGALVWCVRRMADISVVHVHGFTANGRLHCSLERWVSPIETRYVYNI